MAIQITILGLGEVGASVGLALRYQKADLHRVGLDVLKSAEEAALRADAVDRITHSYAEAVKDAAIVVLSVPTSERKDTLNQIAPHLGGDAAVLDFCLNKSEGNRLARKYLPKPDQFIGLHPALNRAYLGESEDALRSAHEDLFKGGTLFIAPTASTDAEVVDLAKDFASLLGAFSAFIDPIELDGLLARSEMLPNLLSTAAVNAAFNSTGWDDQRKVGGKPFYALTKRTDRGQAGRPTAQEWLGNRDHLLQALNETAAVLRIYRDALEANDAETLSRMIDFVHNQRDVYLDQYERAVWRNETEVKPEKSSFGDVMGQFFLGGLLSGKREKNA